MASMSSVERKKLSSMGAVRMSRKQAIAFLQTSTTTQYIYTLMSECKMDGQEGCLGYILYQQLDKKTYAAAL
eukprot:2910564-Heterocapsa_arctica.AAC.1